AAMQPTQIGSVEIDERSLTVYLAAATPPATVDALRQLVVPSATGPITLQDAATVEQREGPTSITTERGRRTATITVPMSSDNLAVASASVSAVLEEVSLPDGASAQIGGVATQQQDAFTQLG